MKCLEIMLPLCFSRDIAGQGDGSSFQRVMLGKDCRRFDYGNLLKYFTM
jgi:hypothetical protein